MLFIQQILFFTLLGVSIQIEKRRTLIFKNQHMPQRSQMGNTQKILLKIAGFYTIFHRELLATPSFVFIFDILKCGHNIAAPVTDTGTPFLS